MTREELAQKAGEWLIQQGVSTVLLASILAFMGYDKVRLQPSRDELQRSAYKEMQDQAAENLEKFFDRIETANDQWRQAVLNAKGLRLSPVDPMARVERPTLERTN